MDSKLELLGGRAGQAEEGRWKGRLAFSKDAKRKKTEEELAPHSYSAPTPFLHRQFCAFWHLSPGQKKKKRQEDGSWLLSQETEQIATAGPFA